MPKQAETKRDGMLYTDEHNDPPLQLLVICCILDQSLSGSDLKY